MAGIELSNPAPRRHTAYLLSLWVAVATLVDPHSLHKHLRQGLIREAPS